jgi:hypothetical protein
MTEFEPKIAATHAELDAAEAEAGELGAHFLRLDDHEIRAAWKRGNPFFTAAMWDHVAVGEPTRLWFWVTNPASGWGLGALHIHTFFGPGFLSPTTEGALEYRDQLWPVLTSAGFVVPVGETRRVELGFNAPMDFATRPIRGPHAPFNALLYVGEHTGPAAALARLHVHVPVRVTAWGL